MTFIFTTGLCLAPLNAAELLVEHDFESVPSFLPGWGGGYGGGYKPATAWKTPFTVTLDTSNPHSGAKSVKVAYLESAKGDKTFHSQGISLPDNSSAKPRRIRIRFFYRLAGISSGALHFSAMELNSQTKGRHLLDGQKVLSPLPPTDEWHSVEYVGKLSADTNQIQLTWVNTSDEAPAALSIDDISVDLVTPDL
jgi:hypothetical protein